MASASGVTAAPLTNAVGVALTPIAAARAVTYGGQSRYIPLSRQAENPSLRPTSRPIPASSALLRPALPSGGWLTNSACAYCVNRWPSAAQPDAAAARGVARRGRRVEEVHR